MNTFKKEIKKACGGCPFKRINNNEKPNPGGSSPLVYLGQARGPFWLPCHNDKSYEGKDSSPSKVSQCAGASIFRTNCKGKYRMPKELLSLPEDPEMVFANEIEFFSYYTGLSIADTSVLLDEDTLDKLMYLELNKVEAKKLN
jgi:hypothetical protein